MPVKPTAGENEQDFIGRCMSEEKDSFPDNIQRYAVCKSKWDNAEFEAVELEKIPIEIVGDNEEKILEYLPSVKPHETEDDYLKRCVIVLYPEYTDEQKGYSLCADKYQRVITVSDKRRETNLKSMKAEKMSAFERNQLEFQTAVIKAEKGIDLADYPWEQCVIEQTDKYGDKKTAEKICGYIKSKYGK